MSTDPTARVGDQDRQRVARSLGVHVEDGRLTLTEYDERLGAAYSAKTFADFEPLLSDLPSVLATTPRSTPVVSSAGSWSAGGCSSDQPLPQQWAVWALVNTICVGIWLAVLIGSGHASGFWPIWVIGPWGLVLTAKSIGSRSGITPAGPSFR